ncbi:MAG: UDP-glucose 4-epimerase GalE [Acidimicrobiia bacterium]|nr:UDP-glucose 4-epimerase GalE [Acidimicrobiia bacterium]
MRTLVTGGAGYIGSQTVRDLVTAGTEVVVLDDLSTGHTAALPDGVALVQASLADAASVRAALDGVDAVLHFAASIEAGESVTDPRRFWRNNTANTLTLLDAMVDSGVHRLVFSSTAAVYGNPESVPITEDAPLRPTNPYGQTKLASEMAIGDYARAYGIRHVILRYFNAAGADPSGLHGPDHHHKTHLITLCMEAAAGRVDSLSVFGTDYPTPDGTCIRDYIHVADLAAAHLDALRYLGAGGPDAVFNLGNGTGHSVRDVVACAHEVTGVDFAVVEASRREGDPTELVASSERASAQLGWRPTRGDLATIVGDAWRWHESHPRGYGE